MIFKLLECLQQISVNDPPILLHPDLQKTNYFDFQKYEYTYYLLEEIIKMYLATRFNQFLNILDDTILTITVKVK